MYSAGANRIYLYYWYLVDNVTYNMPVKPNRYRSGKKMCTLMDEVDLHHLSTKLYYV